ncbi:hypothetical protein ZIOFF_012452 [Zingiber officinale]|uniref:Uncharacterized protein n=1 Tax=Zingiber officinale TaxID=94328 RepID=A0A8J5HKP2_ZINOF|nr:hypothetical protein ZIOFF_012452 [Zingiber officinale]
METTTNNGSQQKSIGSSFSHPSMVSFQPGTVDSSTEMVNGYIPTFDGNSSMASIFMCAGSGVINHMDTATQAQYTPGSVLQELMPRFTNVSGSPAYWSPGEVDILNRGLISFASESSIQQYSKIAAMLPQKTIRDVALRCQWIISKENVKRRKTGEYYASKMMKDTKERRTGIPSASTSMAPDLLTMHHLNIHDQLLSEGHVLFAALDAEMKSILIKNETCLRAIAQNLEGGMMQNNLSLFRYMRNNIATAENRINTLPRGMNQLPGSLKQIPPIPVSANDELLSSLIPLNEHVIYTTPGGSSSNLQSDLTCYRPPNTG